MLAGCAKDVARQWVQEEAVKVSRFHGAFFHGSVNWLSDDAIFPEHSDVDVMVVLDVPKPPSKLGKLVYQDVLLEISYLPKHEIASPEMVLGQYHLAGSFQSPSIILDPTGELTRLQAAVAKDYAKREWVYRRCQHARDKILNAPLPDETWPFPDQVLAWLFPAAITTHILLVAGLRNPTVRRRYVETKRLLEAYGYLDLYEPLLELLGCVQMSRKQVEHHLETLTEVFDVAKMVTRTPFFFSSDITDLARPIAIDGSWEMIESGFYREAVFWIVATYSRCQKVLFHDGSDEMHKWADGGYRRLLLDLGIRSLAQLKQGREKVRGLLPHVWQVAEGIMATNPEIED